MVFLFINKYFFKEKHLRSLKLIRNQKMLLRLSHKNRYIQYFLVPIQILEVKIKAPWWHLFKINENYEKMREIELNVKIDEWCFNFNPISLYNCGSLTSFIFISSWRLLRGEGICGGKESENVKSRENLTGKTKRNLE